MPMTPEEIAIVRELGFDEKLADFVRVQSRTPMKRLRAAQEDGSVRPAPGLSVAVADGDEAERLINGIRSRLMAEGYRAFWSERRAANGLRETQEVAIFKTTDPYLIVRIRGTDGANYDISTEDILNRLAAWEQLSAFEVVGASSDWVALQFGRLPENICAFAEEVCSFCPDSVEQGVGLARERDDPERFKAARLLCPEISVKADRSEEIIQNVSRLAPGIAERFKELLAHAAEYSTPTDMGIRLLAFDLSRKKYLFLWWD
jgi:hypothetical protein